jgi:GNAT superfamily N-acetyltransferase
MAYHPNRAILGVEPLPLLADYADIVRDMHVWLFERQDIIAAALILTSESDHLLIWSVATHPEHQGRGLGNVMMQFAEDEARRCKLPQLRLYTGSKLVDRIRWYERKGYLVERHEDLSDRQITHMAKQLEMRRSAG